MKMPILALVLLHTAVNTCLSIKFALLLQHVYSAFGIEEMRMTMPWLQPRLTAMKPAILSILVCRVASVEETPFVVQGTGKQILMAIHVRITCVNYATDQ